MSTLQKENETLRDELARTQERLSEARAELAKHKSKKALCLHCGKDFVRKFGHEQSCSKRCAAYAREAIRSEKTGSSVANSFLSARA